MDKRSKIKTVLERNLRVGERVTERKMSRVTKDLDEIVDWGDARDTHSDSTNKKSVDWGDGTDQ